MDTSDRDYGVEPCFECGEKMVQLCKHVWWCQYCGGTYSSEEGEYRKPMEKK